MAQPPLPASVQQALQRGNTIEAIKLLRQETGLGLQEAKQWIDGHRAAAEPASLAADPATGLPAPVMAALQRGNRLEAIRVLRELTGSGLKEARQAVDAAAPGKGRPAGLAPGEVPPSRAGFWLLLAAIAGLVAWLLLR